MVKKEVPSSYVFKIVQICSHFTYYTLIIFNLNFKLKMSLSASTILNK